MYSCDTFALGKDFYHEHKNFFAKNSDRPLGEAQPLCFYPRAEHKAGDMLHCTHLSIPQTNRTYAVMGCRPYWIWGFEMGVNECGLAIGNEAEGSRCEAETEEGMLGMDMLRLALERAATAREGVDVIAQMLTRYGQNANANPLYDRRYENSFLLVDPQEIYLMETAGRHWVAKRITSWAAISNTYSIGTEFDLCSDGLEEYARARHWLHPDEPFDFAKAYLKPGIQQRGSTPRWRRLQKLITACNGALTIPDAQRILRDHFEDEIICPRFGGTYGGFVSICMHAMTWDASQTAASLLYSWHDTLGPVCWYAPSSPCCSVYIPVYWTSEVPAILSQADGVYDPASLWWVSQRLVTLVSIDEARFGKAVRNRLQPLEESIRMQAADTETAACALINANKKDEALSLLSRFTQTCTENVCALMHQSCEEISQQLKVDGGIYGMRREVILDYADRTRLPL